MPPGGLRLQIVRGLAEMTGTTPADIEALCGLRSDPAQAGRMTQKRPRVARTAPTALEQKVLRLLMRYPALAARLDADTRTQLTAPELPQGEVLSGLLAECDTAGPEMHFGAFVERLGQTPYAEAFAGLRVAVLNDDIEPRAGHAGIRCRRAEDAGRATAARTGDAAAQDGRRPRHRRRQGTPAMAGQRDQPPPPAGVARTPQCRPRQDGRLRVVP